MKTLKQFLNESDDSHDKLTKQGYSVSIRSGGNRTYTRNHRVSDYETHQLNIQIGHDGKVSTQAHRHLIDPKTEKRRSLSGDVKHHESLGAAIQHNIDYANKNPRRISEGGNPVNWERINKAKKMTNFNGQHYVPRNKPDFNVSITDDQIKQALKNRMKRGSTKNGTKRPITLPTLPSKKSE